MTFLLLLTISNLSHCLCLVLLYSKTPKQVFFNPINIFDTFTHSITVFYFFAEPTYIQIRPFHLTTRSNSINKLAVANSTERTVNQIEKTRRGSLNTVMTKQNARQLSSQIRVQERIAMRQKNKIEEVDVRKKKLNELIKLKMKIFKIKKFAEQTREMKNRVIVLKKIEILVSESKGAPGIVIEDREGDMVVTRVMKNGLAAQAGVVKGFTLLRIGGKSVKGTALRKVENAIRRCKFMQKEINFLFEEGEKGKKRKKSVTKVRPSLHERMSKSQKLKRKTRIVMSDSDSD